MTFKCFNSFCEKGQVSTRINQLGELENYPCYICDGGEFIDFYVFVVPNIVISPEIDLKG